MTSENPTPDIMDLTVHQARVVLEKHKLDERINKLKDFLYTDTFSDLSDAEQNRLLYQLHHMGEYTKVLGERIAEFGDEGLNRALIH